MKQFCRALLLLAIALAILLSAAMQAQTFTVLHTFTGANDGDEPQASLTLDGAGNLYGTASYGGSVGMGTVFKLTDRPSGWALTTLYSFSGGSDGAIPLGGVIFGPDGSLYGDTSAGGDSGYGTVFNLKPQPRVCNSTECPWLKTTLYQFTDEQDGSAPMGNLLANAAGDLFGTTSGPFGSVYKLIPTCTILRMAAMAPSQWPASRLTQTAASMALRNLVALRTSASCLKSRRRRCHDPRS
jgi:uncharacterized repeat protein (TIGR03803 family)